MIFSGSAPMQPVTMTLPFVGERLADGGERLRLRAVEKAAGVDDHQIGAGVLAGELVALGAQPRDDALAVDQRLRAAERDEAHLRRARVRRRGGHRGDVHRGDFGRHGQGLAHRRHAGKRLLNCVLLKVERSLEQTDAGRQSEPARQMIPTSKLQRQADLLGLLRHFEQVAAEQCGRTF